MHLPDIDLVCVDAQVLGDGARQGIGDVATVHLQREESNAQDGEEDEIDLRLYATLFVLAPVDVRTSVDNDRNGLLAG